MAALGLRGLILANFRFLPYPNKIKYLQAFSKKTFIFMGRLLRPILSLST
ncbi:Uncharacterised protein [Haemophilus pittmaniae]|nr:Uncharacterised protein [Haemophilus pittmaniae]